MVNVVKLKNNIKILESIDVGNNNLIQLLKYNVIKCYESKQITRLDDAKRMINALNSKRRDGLSRYNRIYNRVSKVNLEKNKTIERKNNCFKLLQLSNCKGTSSTV